MTLPKGLSLDVDTGIISGIPKETCDVISFTIQGENSISATVTVVQISVRKGQCVPDGNFGLTNVGVTAVYECKSQGDYIGKQTRQCVLGKQDGEWQKVKGFCMAIGLLIALIVGAVVLIIIIIFIIVKISTKRKAVKGVKSKTTSKKESKTLTKV